MTKNPVSAAADIVLPICHRGESGPARRSVLVAGAALLTLAVPNASATPHDDQDADLIVAAERCIELDIYWAQLLRADTEDKGSPEITCVSRQITELFGKVRSTKAQTLKGLAAKARVFDRIIDAADLETDVRQYSVEPEHLAYSICRDLLGMHSRHAA